MNNEEILLEVQTEVEEKGEYERFIERRSLAYGAAFGVAICMLLMTVEFFVFKKMDYGKPTILLGMCAFAHLYEGKNNGIRKLIICGCIETILAILGLVLFVGALLV